MTTQSLGVRIGGQVMGWDEAFHEAATNPLRPWPFTADMLALMAGIESEEPSDGAFSPSRLLGCHRQAALKSKHGYYVDAESSWPLVRGNMVHALMERARYPGALETIRERRFYTTIQTRYGPQQFTAKPDLIVVERMDYEPFASRMEAQAILSRWEGEREVELFRLRQGYERDSKAEWGEMPPFEDWSRSFMESWDKKHPKPRGNPVFHVKIVDYKSKGKIEHSLTEASLEHELQVCMYALIVTRELGRELGGDVVVDEVEIDYVDMSRVRRFTSAGWLTDRGKLVSRKYGEYETLHLAPIRLWNLEQVERFVRRRIEERIQARRVLPPMLKEEERWRCNYCPVREACLQRSEEAIA